MGKQREGRWDPGLKHLFLEGEAQKSEWVHICNGAEYVRLEVRELLPTLQQMPTITHSCPNTLSSKRRNRFVPSGNWNMLVGVRRRQILTQETKKVTNNWS